MTDYKSMRDAELHTALLQSTAELAGLAVDISLQRLIRCLRKAYHAEQPRDETGRWTPFGGFGQADRQPRAESVQVAQGGRGVPRLPGSARIMINGREFEVSNPQQIRIERAVDRYNAAYEQIIERDPNWKPRPSLSSPNSVEDEVRVRDDVAPPA